MAYYVTLQDSVVLASGEVSYTDDILTEFLKLSRAIEITLDQKILLNSGGLWKLIDGVLESHIIEITLTEAKESAIREIDRLAESARLRFVTRPMQSDVYQLKQQEANRFLAIYDEINYMTASPEDWSFLNAEVGITGETLFDVAVAISVASIRWVRAASSIEEIRLRAKKNVNECLDVESLPLVNMIIWPLP